MDPVIILAALGIGYLIGSLSFARIFLRLLRSEETIEDLGIDLAGSKETSKGVFGAGADSASIILGAKYGIVIGILDVMKVFAPMLLINYVFCPLENCHLLFSFAALIGHNWPLYFKFRGGRGFSVIFGSFLAIDWLGAFLTTILGMLLGIVVFEDLILAYSGWLWLMTPWLFVRSSDFAILLYSVSLTILFLLAAIPEIKEFLSHSHRGNLDSYNRERYNSSARWRGMKKMQDTIARLGRFKYGAKILALILVGVIFFLASNFAL
jgi:glycerol-3-phosphate acyltransferase PlsY